MQLGVTVAVAAASFFITEAQSQSQFYSGLGGDLQGLVSPSLLSQSSSPFDPSLFPSSFPSPSNSSSSPPSNGNQCLLSLFTVDSVLQVFAECGGLSLLAFNNNPVNIHITFIALFFIPLCFTHLSHLSHISLSHLVFLSLKHSHTLSFSFS
jgi:hypothetical protein